MAYIGLEPSNSFVSLKRQVITGDGTASYTLDHSVASVNDVAIFVNNVRQDPAGYSISGAALTLGGTIQSSDDCYVIFLGQALQTVTPDSNTITAAMLQSDVVTAAKLNDDIISGTTALTSSPDDTDELLISDAGTLKRIDYSLIKPTNTPAFYAYKSSGQSVAQNTYVKVTFETELFDSDGKFADSRFTPTVAGHYFVSSTLAFTNHPAGAYCFIGIYKNGSSVFSEINTNQSSGDADTKTTATFMIYLDSDDYLEIYTRHNAGQSETTRSGQEVRFMAQRIIE